MSGLTIWTYDWVPPRPRGFVRDLRLAWACEEAGLAYTVRTVAFEDRATNHLGQQPFGQVPFLEDGDIRTFESGACLLHVARKSEALMPQDAAGEAETVQWLFAALNSIEMVSVPWWFMKISGEEHAGLAGWLTLRLGQLENVLAERDWIAAGRFTAADILMADVLRVPEVRALPGRPASEAYVARLTSRPAFLKAHAAQIARFEAADRARETAP
jgi:glutathione S-transferase